MTSQPAARTRAATGAPARLARHVPLPQRRSPERGVSGAGRDLVIAASTVVAMAAVLTGPLVWGAAILLLAAMILGTLQVVGDVEGLAAEHGVPVETLFLPAVAAIGCLGAIRLVPLGLAIVPALLLTGLLIDRTLAVEARIAAAPQGPTAEDRTRALIAMLVVAFIAFTGVAAIVPGGIAGLELVGAPATPLPIGDLVLLALADAVVAGLLGYRAAALRATSVREALWAALTYGIAIAIGAAAIRSMGIRGLLGPALLMFVFYLWDSLHAVTPTRRSDPRWIWEMVVLAGLGAAVAYLNLRVVG